MKSLPIQSFFRWSILVDSLTLELSSLAPLKRKRKENLEEKTAINKTSVNDVVSVDFQIVFNVLKIVKTKTRKQKL